MAINTPTFLPHNGAACPVPPTTKVVVQFRNGWECTEAVEAGEYDWTWSGHTDLHIVGFAEVEQREDHSMGDPTDQALSRVVEEGLQSLDERLDKVISTANPPAPALDYEAQFAMAANSKAGAWGLVDVLRDMARRLTVQENRK